MKPTVFTPFFVMCLISAAAIRSSFCVVLNTQRFFASSGSTTVDVPTVAITGTLASAMMSRIASAFGRRRRADHRVDVVLLDQLLDVLHGARRVAAVVELDVLDRRVADLPRQEVAGVLLRNADRRGGPGRGDHEADLHLRGGGQRGDQGRDEQRGETDHGHAPGEGERRF